VLRLQREDVAGLDEIVWPRAGVDRHLHGAGAVVRRDAGGDPLARLDRDGEGGLEGRLVLGGHEVEAELVAALAGERQADQAAAVGGHEVDRVGRDELGGHREVALVLAVLGIADHDHPPLADGLDRLLDGAERRIRHRIVSFSTYFASTSTSRFTVRPGAAAPSVVRSSVSGMRETSNARSSTPETVRDTPSTAIEPFSTTYLSSSEGGSIRTTRELPSSVTDSIVPVPSTCPCTRWPPSRSLARSGSSRFTSSPIWSGASDVRRSVSGMTSAANEPFSRSVAVRQTPFTAIESPGSSSSARPLSISTRPCASPR